MGLGNPKRLTINQNQPPNLGAFLCLFFLASVPALAFSVIAMQNHTHNQTTPATPNLSEKENRTLYAFDILPAWRNAKRNLFWKDTESVNLDHREFYRLLDEIETKHFPLRKYGKSEAEAFLFKALIIRDADLQERASRFVQEVCDALDDLHKSVKQEEQDRKDRLDCAKRTLEQYQHNDKFNGFVSFYYSVQEEYSPAEGGCWFIRRTPVACYPARNFLDTKTGGLDRGKLEAEAERLGLTLDGTEIDGRPAKIRSCAPEADCEAFLEQYPFEGTCLFAPRYE